MNRRELLSSAAALVCHSALPAMPIKAVSGARRDWDGVPNDIRECIEHEMDELISRFFMPPSIWSISRHSAKHDVRVVTLHCCDCRYGPKRDFHWEASWSFSLLEDWVASPLREEAVSEIKHRALFAKGHPDRLSPGFLVVRRKIEKWT